MPIALDDELVVLCSGAFIGVLDRLLPAFRQRTGLPVKSIPGASMGTTLRAIPMRLRAGEGADLVILFDETIDELVDEGYVVRGSKLRLAASSIGLAVRSGAAHPDISSASALGQALRAATSFAYSASASGAYVASGLLQKLDLPDSVGAKGFRVMGEPVAAVVARGEAELGFQQMSELLAIEGVDVVGPLPSEVQLRSILSAGIPSSVTRESGARALVSYLLSDEACTVMTDAGLERNRDG